MKHSLRISTVLITIAAVLAIGVLPQQTAGQVAYFVGGNVAPRWNKIANPSVEQGQTLTLNITAVDDNGDALTYALLTAPTGASLNPALHTFTFTPSYNQLGSFAVTITATDNKSTPVPTTFYVNVTTGYGHYVYGGGDYNGYYNQAPYFTSTNSHYVASSGASLSFTVTAVDPEGQEVRYRVEGLPAGASFDSVRREVRWTPTTTQRGTYTLSFYATDGSLTSTPLTVTIVVDGGTTAYNATAYYPGTSNTQYSNNLNCWNSTNIATAGTVYTRNLNTCYNTGRLVSYQLLTAPAGASISNGVLLWSVPSNAVNKDYALSILASDGISSATLNATVTVVGGQADVTTVYQQPKTIVQYTPRQTSTATAYYPTASAVQNNPVVVTGRTVVPTNYPYYAATAYGALASLPARAVGIEAFNIAIRANSANEMVVSWDTNKPTRGEVVFGYASQSRGADLERTILNYDFTTGQESALATRHETSIGALALSRTYYLRVISRADDDTNISREIVFIPMTNQAQQIEVEQYPGAASALASLINFLLSGGFLFFLLLVVISLILYLIALNRRPRVALAGEQNHLTDDQHLSFYPQKHR